MAIFVGIAPPKPLRGFPPGRTRIRMRIDKIATLVVRLPGGGVRRFVIDARADGWWPHGELGANLRCHSQAKEHLG